MEDGASLSQEDHHKMESLKKELVILKTEHKAFSSRKRILSVEEKEKWRLNSHRTNQVFIEIKNLRFKNIIEAGKGR
jgi:hypothetical protein